MRPIDPGMGGRPGMGGSRRGQWTCDRRRPKEVLPGRRVGGPPGDRGVLGTFWRARSATEDARWNTERRGRVRSRYRRVSRRGPGPASSSGCSQSGSPPKSAWKLQSSATLGSRASRNGNTSCDQRLHYRNSAQLWIAAAHLGPPRLSVTCSPIPVGNGRITSRSSPGAGFDQAGDASGLPFSTT